MVIGPPTLLVVDDERPVIGLVTRLAQAAGFTVTSCGNGREALAYLHGRHTDMAMVDVRMPEVGGIDVLKAIRIADPSCQVVIMSGQAGVDTAVEAIKLGALDFITKPFDLDRVRALMTGVRAETERRRAVLGAERDQVDRLRFCGMIGRSAGMQALFDQIRRFAPHVRSALVTGETGTGKELVARALHDTGPRRGRHFVPVNCSAVVETLFESELFGHVRGAFTGAAVTKPGFFEQADGGTLFLDEIGDLPLAMQAKLLRVLESGEVQRVGATDTRRVDVRIVAATNRDLAAEAAAGRFRSDLYYRLSVVEIHLPPLRDRREDIPYLTAAFVRECAARMGKTITGLSEGAEQLVAAADWPGNIRELRNAIERAAMLTDGEFIGEPTLRAHVTQGPRSIAPAAGAILPLSPRHEPTHDEIVKALDACAGNKQAAARMLGLSRRSLYRRLDARLPAGTS